MSSSIASPKLVLVTGVSGAGHSTALKILEDYGFAAVDNLPLALVDPLVALEVETSGRMIAIGLDARTSGFSAVAVKRLVENLRKRLGDGFSMVFIGAAHNDLMRRYNATRRQHPIQDQPDLASAINADMARMEAIEPLATVVIDSSGLAPAGLRRALLGRLGLEDPQLMPITVVSFSYRHGVPDDADHIVDMRFARNPHWDDQLRDMTGLDDAVVAFLRADTDAMAVLDHMKATLDIMLGRMQAEGRPQMTLGFGCTGGKHRSVWAAREMAGWLGEKGYQVTLRHRELTEQ
ncbi:MAG: RNase adapter RapZ [Candidatus Puniceispirillum sp.]